jgi:hypothetical protein
MQLSIHGTWVGYFGTKQGIAVLFLLASSTMLTQTPAALPSGMASAVVMQRTPYYVDPVLLDLSTILPLPPT